MVDEHTFPILRLCGNYGRFKSHAFDHDLSTHDLELLKQKRVVGHYHCLEDTTHENKNRNKVEQCCFLLRL